MARVPLAGTTWIPGQAPCEPRPRSCVVGGGPRGHRHRPGRWPGAGVTDVVVVERGHRRLRRHRQVQRRRALPLRRLVPGRDGDPGAGASSRTPTRSSARTSASARPATSSGVGPRTSTPCAPSSPTSAPSASGPRTSTPPRSPRLWPVGRPEPLRRLRAGRSAAATATPTRPRRRSPRAARRDGVRLRQGAAVTDMLVAGGRVTGVALADGPRSRPARWSLAAGPWSVPLLAAPRHRPADHRRTASRSCSSTRARTSGRSRCSPTWSRCSTSGPRARAAPVRQLRPRRCLEPADPDHYSNQATSAFLDLAVEKVGDRFPGLANASIAATYAGCYDVTPDFNPVISATPRRRAVRRRRVLAGTASRSPRPSGGSSPTSSSTARAPTPTSPTGLPALPLRRGRPAAQPPSLRRRRPDALTGQVRGDRGRGVADQLPVAGGPRPDGEREDVEGLRRALQPSGRPSSGRPRGRCRRATSNCSTGWSMRA